MGVNSYPSYVVLRLGQHWTATNIPAPPATNAILVTIAYGAAQPVVITSSLQTASSATDAQGIDRRVGLSLRFLPSSPRAILMLPRRCGVNSAATIITQRLTCSAIVHFGIPGATPEGYPGYPAPRREGVPAVNRVFALRAGRAKPLSVRAVLGLGVVDGRKMRNLCPGCGPALLGRACVSTCFTPLRARAAQASNSIKSRNCAQRVAQESTRRTVPHACGAGPRETRPHD